MPKDASIKKVLVIGSGPIVIGQAAEFDYAGTQACRALMEEGVEVVLVNSNPATIMTDPDMASRVYIEPLTVPTITKIIAAERPDALLPGLGGQTGLNMAMELNDAGVLNEYNVKLLGTPAESIKKAEDREAFRDTMLKLNQPIIDNVIATDVDTALAFAHEIGYPVIVRPAYTLGGSGGGMAHNDAELSEICANGLRLSRVHQALIERSVAGWKEIEFEVMRDSTDNVISICDMENIDPVGIHTGDSIVVAPCQSITHQQYQMLKTASFDIIRELKISGGCNVQYALHPETDQYYIIEVNPRVSRSSALASKATGYPIAKVTSKVALGYRLDEIAHKPGAPAFAHHEPNVKYRVIKFPRWPFDKFPHADKLLGTRMKATGEVMAIGETFEAAWNKAIRSLELSLDSLEYAPAAKLSVDELTKRLNVKDDERIFYVTEALRRGISIGTCYDITMINPWFLKHIKGIVDMEEEAKSGAELTEKWLKKAKAFGISDAAIARFSGRTEEDIRKARIAMGVIPNYIQVNTCPAGVADLPYYYSAYGLNEDLPRLKTRPVVVLGSGPIRIGQGIEFDYCSVHSIWALRGRGYSTAIINCNPETVSTDFDTADLLFFEPCTPEDVCNVLDRINPMGVIVQCGGQTAIKLTHPIAKAGYKILGTDVKHIDMAEDRGEFDAALERLSLARPRGTTISTADEAVKAGNDLGYPVLVRPSYVLGGQGMEIAYSENDIREYMAIIERQTQEHPILVDKYLNGREVEVDAICDGDDILIPGIMEHIERAGVHSGDSISLYPAISISASMRREILATTRKLAHELQVYGMINIQYIVKDNALYLIEVNPRSSRTVPYISKVTGIPMVELATRCMLGEKLKDIGCGTGIAPESGYYAVKVPVFSFEKLPDVEVSLGPEMKSTGEVLGLAPDLSTALYKGLLAAGLNVPTQGGVLFTVADNDKTEVVGIAQGFERLGYDIYATVGTAKHLNKHFVGANEVQPLGVNAGNSLENAISQGKLQLIVNTPTRGRAPSRDGFRIRRMAVERGIPCLTSLDTVNALRGSMEKRGGLNNIQPICLNDITFGVKKP